jgi:hypothetical protein
MAVEWPCELVTVDRTVQRGRVRLELLADHDDGTATCYYQIEELSGPLTREIVSTWIPVPARIAARMWTGGG